MARRGRPPKGAELVDSLGGEELARSRLKVILRTLSGELSVQQACAELGVGESRFHELRSQALGGALAGLEPKSAGRKPTPVPPRQDEIEALRSQIEMMKLELRFAHAREELAVGLPGVFDPQRAEEAAKKKTRARREKERRRKKARKVARRARRRT
jgi:hypothetical protein